MEYKEVKNSEGEMHSLGVSNPAVSFMVLLYWDQREAPLEHHSAHLESDWNK